MNDGLDKTLYDLKNTIAQVLFVPIHKAGTPFILAFAVVAVLLAMVAHWLGFVGLVLTLWCVYFFRDPVRAVPQEEGLIISPADGRVSSITEAVPLPPELRTADDPANDSLNEDGDFTRISVFLSVFDVHVNRVPVSGLVKKVVYRPGLFLNADDPRASFENERSAALIALPNGTQIGVVQVAGLVARRILSDLQEGVSVETGQRYGIIRFGSRADIYIPSGVKILVAEGQRMIGGESVLADLKQQGTPRETKAI